MFVFQLTLFPYLTFLYTLFLSCEPLVLIHCVISYLHYCSFPYAIVLCRLLLVCYCSAFCYCSSQNNIFHFSVTLLISVFSLCFVCSHYYNVFSSTKLVDAISDARDFICANIAVIGDGGGGGDKHDF